MLNITITSSYVDIISTISVTITRIEYVMPTQMIIYGNLKHCDDAVSVLRPTNRDADVVM